MAKKKFKIRAKLVFSGYFTVQASSKQETEAKIQKDCGCLLGSVQTLNEDIDWDFGTHGDIVFNKDREKEGV